MNLCFIFYLYVEKSKKITESSWWHSFVHVSLNGFAFLKKVLLFLLLLTQLKMNLCCGFLNL